ncbi:MAG: sulfurtransferase-like selenium metabolism protein YedF, partial [Deltaproteobacteria bacterium CG06_land_8_20_14_3_00_44_19]
MTKVIDARGLACPQPVINTKKALEEIKEGIIAVVVDNVAARDNVRRFAESQG